MAEQAVAMARLACLVEALAMVNLVLIEAMRTPSRGDYDMADRKLRSAAAASDRATEDHG